MATLIVALLAADPTWLTNLDEALAAARTGDRPVLLYSISDDH